MKRKKIKTCKMMKRGRWWRRRRKMRMRMRIRMRIRMRMRMMAKILRLSASVRWLIHWLTMQIPW
jgi:hypothetical protein